MRAKRFQSSVGVFLAGALVLSCFGASLPAPGLREIPRELSPEQRESARRLPFEGAHNFRDLGGYRTVDGRRVRWGLLYRSDDLSDLTGDDLEFLSRLDLSLLVDFRSPGERKRAPNRLPEHSELRVVALPIFNEAFDPEVLRSRILAGERKQIDFHALLLDENRDFVLEFSDIFAELLRDLADRENLPVLFHCTAGKDRTGFAAAVVLLALGVPREVVFDDYMLTNVYAADNVKRLLRLVWIGSFFQIEPSWLKPALDARREYLQAAFDAIESRYGSVESYLRDGLGLTEELRARLRQNLLEATAAGASWEGRPAAPAPLNPAVPLAPDPDGS